MRISHLILLALVVISIGMYMSDHPSIVKPTADIASLELVDASTTLTPDTPIDPEIRGQALDFIHELTSSAIPPIAMGQADHFVGRDQLLKLLPITPATTDPVDGPIVNRLPDMASIVAQEIAPQQYADKQPLRATITRNAQTANRQHSPHTGSSRGFGATDHRTVAELLADEPANDMDLLYYVRTVQNTDHRGIWGIIVEGLTDNFARGIAIRRNEQLDTYAVTIPDSADQMHTDASSSFLGRLVYSKSRDSYVYNFRENTMGRDPDLIFPGQELVIIDFEPQELIAIYSHFVASSSTKN